MESLTASESPDRLLTAGEIAELLNVPIGWVREHSRTGGLPCIRLGRYRRYDRAEVDEWVRGNDG